MNWTLSFLLRFLIFTYSFVYVSQSLAYQIQYKGLSRSERNQVNRKFSQLTKKELSSYDQIDHILRFIMSFKRFQSVEAQRIFIKQREVIVIKAEAVKTLANVEFLGNESVEDEELATRTKLKTGFLFNTNEINNYADVILKIYAKYGYFNPDVRFEIRKYLKNQINLNIQIQENKVCKFIALKFESENDFLNKKLLEETDGLDDDECSKEVINKIEKKIKDYFLSKRYLRAKISSKLLRFNRSKDAAEFIFKIKNPYRYEFLFSGNNDIELSSSYFIKTILDSSISNNTKQPAEFTADLIKNEYLKKGYSTVDISTKERVVKETFRKEIIFEISEGVKTKIKSIKLKGTFSQEEKYYINFIKKHSSKLIRSGYYNKIDLDKGISNLLVELKNNGFLKVKKTSSDTLLKIDNSEVNITIGLNEGPLTTIKEIKFTGNKSFTKATLLKLTELKNNTPLRLKKVEASIVKLTQHYKNNGYLEMKLNKDSKDKTRQLINYTAEYSEARLNYRIKEGPKIKVGSILIQGNSLTKDHVIFNALEFKIGDVLTPDLINESRTQLERLGLFSKVVIDTVEKDSNTAKRTVLIELEEQNPGTFRLGMGISNERNLTGRGYLALSYDNLFGTAREFNGRLEFNRDFGDTSFLEHRLTINYLEPFFLSKYLRGRIGFLRSKNVFSIDDVLIQPSGSERQVSVLEKNDVNFDIDYKFADHYLLRWKFWNFSRQRTFEKDRKFADVDRRIAKTGVFFEIDHRNNIFNPTSGNFSRMNIDYSSPILGSTKTIEFMKYSFRSSFYWSVFKSITWVNSFRGGYIKNLNTDDGAGVPAVELFFLGGRRTIRGFAAIDERFPSKVDLGVKKIDDFILTGESHYGLVKTEIRFPIYGSLGGSIFYDGGLVKISGIDFLDAYRESVGFGLRYITPVGPLNFEFGFKLDRNEDRGEEKFEFHFSFGSF